MTRHPLDLGSIPLSKRLSPLPIIVDPSHGTGDWRLVPALARAALALDADGIIVEVHPDPVKALSDAPGDFAALTDSPRHIFEAIGAGLG
jgi:3-deoxy-7-phosphoheptulonate synthase